MGFPYFPQGDTFKVYQQNVLEDHDFNLNYADIGQVGVYNYGNADQDIKTGDNDQDNSSYIKNFDGWGWYGSSGDEFHVGQMNYAKDVETNVNDAGIYQLGKSNDAYADQDIKTGDNEQDNSSYIKDVGGWSWYGSGGDTFNVGQSNILVDSEVNVNSANVTQLGLYNDADVYQDIKTGDNDQSNGSTIYNIGGYDGGDVFNINQSNAMLDSEHNVNAANVHQGGWVNDAYVNQDINTGDNTQSNSSEIYDFG